MKLTKRIIAIIICVAMGILMLPKISRAATFEVRLSEDTFIGPDSIKVTLTVKNDSSYPMTDICVSACGRDYGSEIVIQPNETQQVVIQNFYVSQDVIGKDVEFVLTWKENGQKKSSSTSVHINDATNPYDTPEPTLSPEELIEFVCYADNPRAKKDETVKVTYKVVNNSNINMTDITITDSGIASEPVVSGGKVGAKDTGYFTYKYVMGDDSVETSPIMSYSLNGEMRSLRGNSVVLESVTVNMEVSIKRMDPNSNGTEFIIKMVNNGNKPISDVRVFKNDEKIEHAFDLGVGEQKEISYTEKPKGKSEISFKVTGTLATGEAYEYESEAYTVWEYIDPTTVGLELVAEVVKPLDKDGYVSIDFTAKNTGKLDMTDISVEEDMMGKVGSFANLVGGGEEKISLTLFVGEARDLDFKLIGYAPTGEPYEYNQTVKSREVSMGNGDTMPSAFNASSIDVGGAVSKIIKKVLIVLAIISGVFGVGFIVLSVFEIQKNSELKKRKKELA